MIHMRRHDGLHGEERREILVFKPDAKGGSTDVFEHDGQGVVLGIFNLALLRRHLIRVFRTAAIVELRIPSTHAHLFSDMFATDIY